MFEMKNDLHIFLDILVNCFQANLQTIVIKSRFRILHPSFAVFRNFSFLPFFLSLSIACARVNFPDNLICLQAKFEYNVSA